MADEVTYQVGVRITQKMRDALEREAAQLERTLAQHIRFILRQHLKDDSDD